ncbi:hypothetical protein CEQ90_02385 [Lewinellaceae bacterium SD302]|nr:hypothetical protein CEQ90_02385 [Lewinellaceae bacterium SD302]
MARLTTRERKRFLRWLESGLYHSRKGLVELATSCLNDRQSIGKDEKTSRQLTYLGAALENFYAIEGFLEEPYALDRYTALFLDRKQQKERASKMRQRALKQVAKPQVNPQEKLLFQFLIQRDQLEENNSNERTENWKNVADAIIPLNTSLDRLFIFHKLQQACRLATYGNFFEENTSLPLLNAALEVMSPANTNPATAELRATSELQLFYAAYRILSEGDAGARHELTKQLLEYSEFLNFPAGHELFLMLLSDGIKRLNQGEQSYLQGNLDLYDLGLKTGLLMVKNKLNGITFYNIFFLAIKAGRNEWAGQFLEQYRELLSVRDLATIYPYCKANWHYERGELELAADLLANYTGTGGQSLQLQAKATLVKIYYDQQNFDLLDSLLNSMSVSISRMVRLGYRGEIYLPFVRIARKLLRAHPRLDTASADALTKETEEISVRSLRNWLLERIERLR